MQDKIFEVLDYLDSSNLKKQLDIVKNKINKNTNSKKLINNFNKEKDLYEKYGYQSSFIEAKVKLMKDPLIKEYINLQNKVNMLSIYINKKLNDIKNGHY